MVYECVKRGGFRAAPLVLLALVLAALVLVGFPRGAVLGATGQQFEGLYYTVVVDTYVSPAGGGTITGRPYGCAYGTQTPAVEDGHYYFTGTRQPTMAVGYATAPLDFWLTAVPAAGWEFIGWSGVPLAWISGTQCHIQYDEVWCDATVGWYQPTAMFELAEVGIDFRTATGLTYVSPHSGVQNLAPIGVQELEVAWSGGYGATYDFAGWIGDMFTLGRVDDPTAMETYVDMDGSWAFPGSYWLSPTIRPKSAVDQYEIEWTIENGSAGSLCHDTSDNVTLFTKVLNCYSNTDQDWEFQQWVCSNAGCSDIYSDRALFWRLTEGPAEVHCLNVLKGSVKSVVILTMEKVGDGKTVPKLGESTMLTDTRYKLVATAGDGYKFDYWLGLPDGRTSDTATEYVILSEDTTITAVFVKKSGTDSGEGPGPVVSGLWGGFNNLLGGVGLANQMGRMMIVVVGMLGAFVAFRKSKALAIGGPLLILGVGMIGGWVPIWIVVLLALGVGVFLVRGLSNSTQG